MESSPTKSHRKYEDHEFGYERLLVSDDTHHHDPVTFYVVKPIKKTNECRPKARQTQEYTAEPAHGCFDTFLALCGLHLQSRSL